MRLLALIPLLLVGCTLDDVMPDELMLGHGRSTYDAASPYWSPGLGEGESESYSAGLVWHLPSLEDEDRGPRSERIAERAGTAGDDVHDVTGHLGMRLREDVEAPPPLVLLGMSGVVLLFVAIALVRSRRRNGWH